MCSLGIELTTFCTADAMLYHWATGTLTLWVCLLQYELATGRFPYPKWNSVFDQLTQVVKGDPPQLSNSEERQFSPKFIQFVNLWCVHMCLSCFDECVSLLSSHVTCLCLIMCVPALRRTSQKGQSTENCWYVKPVFVCLNSFILLEKSLIRNACLTCIVTFLWFYYS